MALALQIGALVLLLLFLVLGEAPENTRFWTTLFDWGHAPLAGAVALLACGALRRTPEAVPERLAELLRRHAPLVAFVVTVGLGAAVEALQALQIHRNASWKDLARDAAGAAGFLLISEAMAGPRLAQWQRSRRGRWAACAAGAVLLAATGVEFVRTVAVYAERNRAMPTLFALDGAWWERELVEESRSRLTPSRSLARLDLQPASYSGVTFEEPYPDWSGYRHLVLTIASDLEQPLPMTVRVHDSFHSHRYEDRFNRRLTVEPGENVFRIPLDEIRRGPRNREIDLRRIRAILIFTHALTRATHVYLGPLRLE